MTPSRDALKFILQREALVLESYQDGWKDKARTIPKYSIGVGTSDPDLKPGDKIEVHEALARFKDGVGERAKYISKLLKVPIKQNQFDALLSLYYQGGNLKLRPVIKLINDGKMNQAARKFSDPKMATDEHGAYSEGLVKRRFKERLIFEFGSYGPLSEAKLYRGHPRTTKPEIFTIKDEDL